MKMKPINIALAIEGWNVPAWVEAVIRRVKDEGAARWSLVVLCPSDGAAREGSTIANWLRSAYLCLDQRVSPAEQDPLAPVDVRRLLAEIPVKDQVAIEHDGGPARPADFDLIVNFTARRLPQDLVNSVPLGEWRYCHGGLAEGDSRQVGLAEIIEGKEANVSLLEMMRPAGGEPIKLAEIRTAVDRLSAARNRANYFWPSVSLLPRQLMRLAKLGTDEFLKQAGDGVNQAHVDESQSTARSPGKLFIRIANTAARRIRRKFEKRLFRDQWFLLSHFDKAATGPCLDPSKFQSICPPINRFWADPHVVVDDGRHFVFFEDYCYETERAHISVIEREPSGHWTPARIVLERPYHLSYPFVFEWQGQYYMLPETAANKTLELYRCDRFPDRWSLHKVIWRNVQAYDATLFEHAGHWWMFVAIAENEGGSSWDELFLFHADQPLSDHWLPHSHNPIVSDVRRARPAGAVFACHGQLVRPAQDGSKNYGYAMRLARIDALSPTEYAETEMARVTPDAMGWQAMHTLSYGAGLTMMDAQQLRLRWSRGSDREKREEQSELPPVMGDWAAPEAV